MYSRHLFARLFTKLKPLNTGLENAGLMCVVSKGSKEIWVYEKASDKNAIGENGGLLKFAF